MKFCRPICWEGLKMNISPCPAARAEAVSVAVTGRGRALDTEEVDMPRRDGTGPLGMGAMTGGGRGRCSVDSAEAHARMSALQNAFGDSERTAPTSETPDSGVDYGFSGQGCGYGPRGRGMARGKGWGAGRRMGRPMGMGLIAQEKDDTRKDTE